MTLFSRYSQFKFDTSAKRSPSAGQGSVEQGPAGQGSAEQGSAELAPAELAPADTNLSC